MKNKPTNKITIKVVCNLDVLARDRGLKPYEIADLANLSVPTIYDLLSNKVSPSMETLGKLAGALNVTHAELLRTEKV